MSRFPKLTETFVLDEILALEARGVRVEVFPLWRERGGPVHPDAVPVVERAHFTPTLDATIVRDNLAALFARPALYLGTLARLVRANAASPRFLLGALAIFPKAVSFARRMREAGVQHVHAHFASHPAACGFIVGRFADLPWSFTAHGSDLHREQAMLPEKVAEATHVVAISDYNKRFLLEHAGPDAERHADRVHVVHCGVDLDRFSRAPASGAPFEIVCVGTLHAVKGQGFLIDACAALDKEGVAWRLHLVGDGEDRAALEARARSLGIADHVVFHGALDRAGVRAVLARADVSVAPSVPTPDGRREGIPVVLMEAGATALPLVGSRLSGIPELIEDGVTGLLVDPRDTQGLAAALLRLASDPALAARLGRGARERVEREFALESNVDRLAALFFGAGAES
ncbi:MAG: glycosyltransferase family 4 protein [Myxococcota bacterium]